MFCYETFQLKSGRSSSQETCLRSGRPVEYLHRPSCHCDGYRKRTCRSVSGFLSKLLGFCREGGAISRRPTKSRLCLSVSMTAALLQHSAVGRPLHLKAVPSGVSEPLVLFLQLLRFFFCFFLRRPCLRFFFSKTELFQLNSTQYF